MLRKGFLELSLNLVQGRDDLSEDLVDLTCTVYVGDDACLVVVVDEWLSQVLVDFKPVEDGSFPVVVSVIEFATADIADSLFLGGVELEVVADTTLAHPSAAEPLDQFIVWNVDVDDHVDLLAEIGEHFVKSFCLGVSAGVAVQHVSAGHVGLCEPVFDDAYEKLVRYQLTCVHVLLRFRSEIGAVPHVLSQDVASRDVNYAILRCNLLGLSALSGSWWTE